MKLALTAFMCLFVFKDFAQKNLQIKFGKVLISEFKQVYNIDSDASAVVIADIGFTGIVENDKGSFSLQFTRYKKVHILNKNGYDIANVMIDLYSRDRAQEKLESLKAITHNLQNGKVIATKLDIKTGLFKDIINKNLVRNKFTFPNIKEGSIIEFEYKIRSDYTFNLHPWNFQCEYPVLWSEYNVSIPEFYYYVRMTQGYHPFFVQEKKEKNLRFKLVDNSGAERTKSQEFTASVSDYRWVMKDVPALKEESYTSTINNHLARIEFQLAEVRPPYTPRDVMGTWEEACSELLNDEDFGYSLNRDNAWLNDVMEDAMKDASGDLEKAKNIFAYVRDNITCTGHGYIYLQHPLRAVLKNRYGNEAEVNLLLTTMLLKAGLSADPVMLSTRSHGLVYRAYPLLDRFNHVITRLTVNETSYYLDASEPMLGFGNLRSDAYNGHARVINEAATPLEFVADSLLERKFTSVIITNDETGNLAGAMRQEPGYYESYQLRNHIREKGTEQIFSDFKKAFNADIEITESAIDSLNNYDQPLTIRYDFKLPLEKTDILYFNPMFCEAMQENLFKSAVRNYPVEMPYTIDENYSLRFDVPAGYVIDELPKEMLLKLNDEGDGTFEYRLSESNGTITLLS
ncbi:MAG: DUF3857 domain-containing protein, partial [Ferruginibacter sp.]